MTLQQSETKAMFTLYRIVFAPARKPYRIGLLFTYENGDFGTISVTERSHTAPISKVVRHILNRCSCYTGQLFVVPRKSYGIGPLNTHKNCCGGAISVTVRSCAAPISKLVSHMSDRCSCYTR